MSWAVVAVGGATAIAGVASTAISANANKGGGGGAAGYPTYQGTFQPIPNVTYNPSQGAQDVKAMYPTLAQVATQNTNYMTKQREKIFPGSKQIFANAGNVLNSYLQGQIPQDVIDQTNRVVAERLGGSYNPFNAGGQAGNAFARSIGQTSLGIQQMGLSAAPTWQQLAQSFVTNPLDVGNLAMQSNNLRYQYDALNTGINQYNTEGPLGIAAQQYTSGVNSYNAGQIQQNYADANQQALMGNIASLAQAGAGIYNASQVGQNSFSPAGQAYTGNLYNLSNGSPYTGSAASAANMGINLPSYSQAKSTVYGT